MRKKVEESLKRSRFMQSPKAEEIMKVIKNNVDKKSDRDVYKIVKEIDPKVPEYQQFKLFLQRLRTPERRRALAIFEEIRAENYDDRQLVDGAIRKLFGLGNVVMEQELSEARKLIEEGKDLSQNKRDRIMEWFFKGAESFHKGRMVDVRFRETEVEESIADNLLAAAQYQQLKNENEIVDGEIEEEKINQELDEEINKNYED